MCWRIDFFILSRYFLPFCSNDLAVQKDITGCPNCKPLELSEQHVEQLQRSEGRTVDSKNSEVSKQMTTKRLYEIDTYNRGHSSMNLERRRSASNKLDCRRAIRARCPECHVIEAVNSSIMMNVHLIVLVIYTALCGLYTTAYAVFLTKQHNDFICTSAYALWCIMRYS